METTYLIELSDTNAQRLLQDLEDLKIIKVLKKENNTQRKNKTAKFRGTLALNAKQYQDFQQHAKDIRNEWQGNF